MRQVLHILPYDLARGAQRYAQALVDELAQRGGGLSHSLVTLFSAESAVLRPDISLDVPRGLLRRLGLDPRVIIRLRRLVADLEPVAVVAHGGESAKYASLAIPRSTPLVYLKIGTAAESLGNKRFRWGLHAFYTRRSNLVAGVSTAVVEEVSRTMSIPSDRLLVIPNARDPDRFTQAELGRSSQTGLIFVGHLNPGKRPDWFIEAVSEVRGGGTDVRAVMVGDGPLRDSLVPDARRAGVEMLGRRQDVAELLSESEVFVFTSLAPGEGMPGVLIEAGLSGLATVCTDVPGARDVVEHGVTGFVVDVDDKRALIDAVSRLAGDPDLRAEMGARARARCLERFTFDVTAKLWSEVFGLLGLESNEEPEAL